MPKVRPFLLAAPLALALATAGIAAEPIFPPGSSIGLVPPKDMSLAKPFKGFEHPSGASISLIELPPQAYAEIATGFTPEALKAQGFVLKQRDEMTLGGAKAILLSGDQTVGTLTVRKWLLVAGTPSQTALVIAQMLKDRAPYSDADIRNALESLAFRAPLGVEEQIAALPFRLGERAGFRPARVLGGNSLLLTDGPKDVIQEAEQPVLIIASSSDRGPAPDMRETFARRALASIPGLSELRIERAESFRQRNADWHEIVANGKERSGRPVVVIQSIRFAPGSYVRMLGVTRADGRDDVMPRFRAVIDGVEGK